MELHQLRYFVAAAEAGSMTVAARRCNISQPSLSQQIQKLELSLGQVLFDRLGKGVALTEAGEALLPRAREVLGEVAEIREVMSDGRGTARLAVGVIPTIAPYLIPSVLRTLRTAEPKGAVSIREDLTDRLLEALVENTLDIALMSLPIGQSLVETEVIGSDPFVAALPKSHALAKTPRVKIADLRHGPNIVLSPLHCLGQQLEMFCASRSAERQITCEASQLTTVIELVRCGLGTSIVPEMAAKAGHVRGVSFVPLSDRGAARPIVLATRVGRSRSRLCHRFREAALAVMG